jgi:uncharacterized protein YqjF (DUF2071 family)
MLRESIEETPKITFFGRFHGELSFMNRGSNTYFRTLEAAARLVASYVITLLFGLPYTSEHKFAAVSACGLISV